MRSNTTTPSTALEFTTELNQHQSGIVLMFLDFKPQHQLKYTTAKYHHMPGVCPGDSISVLYCSHLHLFCMFLKFGPQQVTYVCLDSSDLM